MICFLRRARRCFVVKGAGAGVLTAWCIEGTVLGVKASELVACFDSCKRNPVHNNLRCTGEWLWIQLIGVSADKPGPGPLIGQANSVSRLNLVNRPLRVLRD